MDFYREFQCRTQHCVSGRHTHLDQDGDLRVSMPHAALCVSGHTASAVKPREDSRFNAARGIMCVGTRACRRPLANVGRFNAARGIMCVGTAERARMEAHSLFQCRTRHYVCRDVRSGDSSLRRRVVSMPHAALCVSGHRRRVD